MTRHRTRRFWILACTCVATAASISAAPAEPRIHPPAPLVDLRQENAELKRQVAELKGRVAFLEAQVAQLGARPAPGVPDPAPNPFDMPGARRRFRGPGSDWIPKQFNNHTFYIVPCESVETVAARATGTSKLTTGRIAAPTEKRPTPAQPSR